MAAVIQTDAQGEILTIRFVEARLLDSETIQRVQKELLAVLDRTEQRLVLLDFGAVRFLSSSALGILIRFNKRCREYKVTLKLAGIAPDIYEVFRITRLDQIFEIFPDAAAARDSFKKDGMFFR